MTRSLDPTVSAFLTGGPHFATIATVDPDGRPRQAVIWYLSRGATLVVNSAVGRRWPTNLVRDGRVSIAIVDRDDGLRWVGATGIAQPITDQAAAQADIAEMARRYHAADPDHAASLIRDRFQRQERISFHIPIDSLHDHLD